MRRLPLLLLLAGAAHAGEASDALFERANQAYLHGDYQAAIDAYEQVAGQGISDENLHYNLANAYFKADRLGPAILHYEQALMLDPSQDDAETNLKLARERAAARWQDRLQGAERDPLWMRVLAPFTLGGLGLAFLGLYAALFGVALAVYLLPRGLLRTASAVMLTFLALGTAAAGGLLAGRWWLERRVEQAIVLPDEVAVKEGPDANDQTSFLIHAGLRVRAVQHEQDWVRVRLANGLEGWLHDRDIGRL